MAASPRQANNCLLDALLLTLANAGHAPRALLGDERARRDACAACRRMLAQLPDPRSRPRQLSVSGTVLAVSEAEHNVAYLQGDTHGPVALRFFLDRYKNSNSQPVRNIRITVYTRYDCAALHPRELSTSVPISEAADAGELELSLFCHMGADGNGYHYDGLFPANEDEDPAHVMDCETSCSESEAPAASMAGSAQVPCPPTLQADLQAFLDLRCSEPPTANSDDAKRLWEAWENESLLGKRLMTLLQAGLSYGDSGSSAGVRLARAFRGFQLARSKRVRGSLSMRGTCGSATSAEGSKCAHAVPVSVALDEGTSRTFDSGAGFFSPAASTQSGTAIAEGDRRRLTFKQSSAAFPSPERPEHDEFVVHAMPSISSPDPRARFEEQVAKLADRLLDNSLLPTEYQNAGEHSAAIDMPSCHCAFQTCGWAGDTEQDLEEHLRVSQKRDLAAAADCLQQSGTRSEMLYACYAAAISKKCQERAPFACTSTERRCLRAFHAALGHPDLCTLVCFVCARRFPYDGVSRNAETAWRILGGGQGKVFGRTAQELENLLGLEAYRALYVPGDQGSDAAAASMQAELLEWRARVTCETTAVDLLCCPEDIRCEVCACDVESLCEFCEVPVCNYCYGPLADDGRKPQQALSNDLMIYYAPREVCELNVTFMEMVCASPCLTTMACFSLEKKYRAERVMDELAQSNARRIAARGNATTFPLPWEQVLTQLQDFEDTRAHTAAALPLPRTGPELSAFVTVLLKTCDGEVTEESLKRLVHAATVRRAVVVQLIENF